MFILNQNDALEKVLKSTVIPGYCTLQYKFTDMLLSLSIDLTLALAKKIFVNAWCVLHVNKDEKSSNGR